MEYSQEDEQRRMEMFGVYSEEELVRRVAMERDAVVALKESIRDHKARAETRLAPTRHELMKARMSVDLLKNELKKSRPPFKPAGASSVLY